MNFYLYELFWGGMNNATSKGLFYLISGIYAAWLNIDEMIGYSSNGNYQGNIIGKWIIYCTFILFGCTQLNLIKSGEVCIGIFYGFVFATTLIILISGIRHELFKN